jgi:hypothetical protein
MTQVECTLTQQREEATHICSSNTFMVLACSNTFMMLAFTCRNYNEKEMLTQMCKALQFPCRLRTINVSTKISGIEESTNGSELFIYCCLNLPDM